MFDTVFSSSSSSCQAELVCLASNEREEVSSGWLVDHDDEEADWFVCCVKLVILLHILVTVLFYALSDTAGGLFLLLSCLVLPNGFFILANFCLTKNFWLFAAF